MDDILEEADIDYLKEEIPQAFKQSQEGIHHISKIIQAVKEFSRPGSGGLIEVDINKVLEYGATYFTVSSIAVDNNELFASWIMSYGREKLSLMANVSDGKLVYKAYQRKADIDLYDHIEYFHMRGLKYLKVTDINRDGLLEGPNFELYQTLKDRFPNMCIAASGGVRSVDDIRKLKDMGLYSVIVGRALYEGKIRIEDLKEFIN